MSNFLFEPGILLMFIRATRQVDWTLHLSSFRSMLPWFFACDRVNYARYGTAYWLEMMALEKTHPGWYFIYNFLEYEKERLNFNHKSVVCYCMHLLM
jgi:hypothetical protein